MDIHDSNWNWHRVFKSHSKIADPSAIQKLCKSGVMGSSLIELPGSSLESEPNQVNQVEALWRVYKRECIPVCRNKKNKNHPVI